MYTKTITYKDFMGNTRTEKFQFHMNEVELMQWVSTPSGATIDNVLTHMREKNDMSGMLTATEDLIKRSYGELSADGREFSKSPEILAKFVNSNAYPALFIELASDLKAADEFLTNVVPSDLEQTLATVRARNQANVEAAPQLTQKAVGAIPSGVSPVKDDITYEELLARYNAEHKDKS